MTNPKRSHRPQKARLNFAVDFATLFLMIAMIGTGMIIKYILPPGSGRRGHGLMLWNLDRHGWGDVHFWLSIALLAILLVHVALHWSWVCNFVRHRIRPNKPLGKLSPRTTIALGTGFFLFVNLLIVWFVWASSSNVFVATEQRRMHNPPHRNLVDHSAVEWEKDLKTEVQNVNSQHKYGDGDSSRGCGYGQGYGRGQGRGYGQGIGYGQGRGYGVKRGVGYNRNRQKTRESVTSDKFIEKIRGYMTLGELINKTGIPLETFRASLSLPKNVSASERIGQLRRQYGFQIEDVREIVFTHGHFLIP